jgi:5-methyltetrahydrofolate--homocysteine methyltransferase
MENDLFKAITSLSKDDALRITDQMLAYGVKPEKILDIGRDAMQVIGDRFETGEYFLPELMVSGDILDSIAEKVKPFLMKGGKATEKVGKVVFGTVQGDIHDIAKNIVVFMLDINGFEVIDLGVDVPAERFVQAVREHQAKIVGLSGFLTLAIEPMRKTIEALKQAGLYDVKVMVGGGPINEMVCEDVGADDWGPNAMDAVSIAKRWVGETS